MARAFLDRHAFGLIVALAFALRLTGIAYGLPHVYHQDEPMMVHHALAVGTGDWNTHYFVIPPFVSYLLFFVYAALFVCGKLAGMFGGKEDFALYFLKDPTLFYLAGRFVIGTLFGTATVALVYCMGRRFFSKAVASAGALFLAVAYGHVQQSHYIYADTPVTFAITLVLYLTLVLMENPSRANFVRLGLALGWAVSIKYTAAYTLPVLVGVFLSIYGKRIFSGEALKNIFTTGAVSLTAFALLAPYTFLDWGHFIDTLQRQAGGEVNVGLGHHLFYSLANGLGAPLLLLALAGWLYLHARWGREAAVLVSFTLTFYIINSFFSQHYARYVLPMLPTLCLFAGAGWRLLSEGPLSGRPWMRGVLLTAVLVSAAFPSLYADALFLKEDTRSESARWFLANAPQGAVVAMDSRFHGPPLDNTPAQIQAKQALVGSEGLDRAKKMRLDLATRVASSKKTFALYRMLAPGAQASGEFLFQGPFVEMSPEALEKIGAEYLVFNFTEPSPAGEALRRTLSESYELAAVFSPYRGVGQKEPIDVHGTTAAPHALGDLFVRKRLGPYLEVYKAKQ